jgi:hypothetical protein
MRIRLVRRPGQYGTKALVEQYGDRLVCVRYRYDQRTRKRYKTVELIVEVADWNPAPPPDTIVALRVSLHETNIQRGIRAAGGVWNRPGRVWELRYDQTVALGLTERIVSYRTRLARHVN